MRALFFAFFCLWLWSAFAQEKVKTIELDLPPRPQSRLDIWTEERKEFLQVFSSGEKVEKSKRLLESEEKLQGLMGTFLDDIMKDTPSYKIHIKDYAHPLAFEHFVKIEKAGFLGNRENLAVAEAAADSLIFHLKKMKAKAIEELLQYLRKNPSHHPGLFEYLKAQPDFENSKKFWELLGLSSTRNQMLGRIIDASLGMEGVLKEFKSHLYRENNAKTRKNYTEVPLREPELLKIELPDGYEIEELKPKIIPAPDAHLLSQ